MSWTTATDFSGQAPNRPVIFGEVLFDCFDDMQVPGGAPLNVAWHLHALGWNPLIISRVGNDEAGRKIVTHMRDWGMDTGGIQHDMQYPTGRVEVTMDGESHTFDILADQAYDFIEPEAVQDAVNPQQCGILYHGSLALRGKSRNALTRLLDTVEAPVFLDINLRDPWWEKEDVLGMIRRTNILKLNDDEFELLNPGPFKVSSLEESAQKAVSEWELDILWLTEGEKGALCCSGGVDVLRVQPDDRDVSVVDTVGAGDSFSAAVIGGFLKGSGVDETAKCATALAARICGRQGATTTDMSLYQGLEAVTND